MMLVQSTEEFQINGGYFPDLLKILELVLMGVSMSSEQMLLVAVLEFTNTLLQAIVGKESMEVEYKLLLTLVELLGL